MKGRPGRFLLLVIGGWCAVRLLLLWPQPPMPVEPAAVPIAGAGVDPPGLSWPRADRWDGFVAASARSRPVAPTPLMVRLGWQPPRAPDLAAWETAAPGRLDRLAMLMLTGGEPPSTHQLLRRAVFVQETDAAPSPPPAVAPGARPHGLRIEGQAYLFLRPGSGRALAAGGALGGSQAAARIAVPVDGDGHLALAARAYRPLASRGAEAALGIDWRPRPDVPLRFSIERRQRLDDDGHSAWSAYAAGGLYRDVAGLRLDAYAQAGIVGARTRDLFADGAIRATRPVTTGPVMLEAGGGLWAAAQPGARRIDIGPRMVVRMPAGPRALSIAVEGRFRVGGNARPGSGLALTAAADL